MFDRLHAKLALLYAGLFGAVLLLIALLVYAAVSANAERAVREELAASGAVFDRVLELRASQLRQSAEVLSRDFGFREAVATGDDETIASALENLRARTSADVALMVRPGGGAVVAGGRGVQAAAPAVRQALQADEEASGVVEFGGDPHQAISAPILSPMLSGWLVLAVRLDAREMAALERLSAIPLDAVLLERTGDRSWSAPRSLVADDKARAALDRFLGGALKDRRAAIGKLAFADGESVVLAKPLPALTPGAHPVLLLRYPIARAMAPYQRLMQTIAATGALGLLLVLAGSWALARSVTRPISALESAARRLEQGEDVEVVVRGRDEVAGLAQSFSAMALAIRERERSIRSHSAELEIALEKADSANRATNEFLATMSHEIRTPLNGVLGLSRVLLQTSADARQRKLLEAIESSATGLERLLSDVLDAARLKAGRLQIAPEPFDLDQAVEAAAALWSAAAAEKGLVLRLELGAAAGRRVLGDAVRLQQILGNLLSNAVKFTERGEILLWVADAPDGRVAFQVSDTGVGFDPAFKAQLFEPFRQADNSATRRFGGSGLGLSICRSLAELMGGELDGDGRPGEGAVFTLVLPLPAAPAARTAPLRLSA
jgi:diguanylate cyclase